MKMNSFFLALFIGVLNFMSGQEVYQDSLLSQAYNNRFSSKTQIAIRAGIGIQKSFYSELGIALQKVNMGDTGFFAHDIYTAVEWTPDRERDLYALKLGYEVNAYLINLGLEAKYQTSFSENDFVITPKIGLGLYGAINVFYGYNISTNRKPFDAMISQHQLSITLNLASGFLKYR